MKTTNKDKVLTEAQKENLRYAFSGLAQVTQGNQVSGILGGVIGDRTYVTTGKSKILWYENGKSLESFSEIASLGFAETIDIERHGLPADAFVNTIEKLKLPNSRVYDIFNIPKSTAAHKIKNNGRFEGTEALASIRLAKLLALAESIAANSLHPDAENFDSGKWLGQWIEYPQPALGGIKPADLLDTETGGQRVYQVLAAIESGSYQ